MVSQGDQVSTPRPVPPTRVRYRVLVWLATAASLAYLCRHSLGVAESTIRTDLGLSLKQSGLLQGAFFWSYALLQVPGGWFAERRGTRVALSVFAIVWSIAMIEMGMAPLFWLLVGAQLVMGAAQAGLLPAAYNSIGNWMPLSQRAFGCGVLAAGMQGGAIASSALVAWLIAPLGWRWVFAILAAPGVLWAIGFFIRFRDRPSQVEAVNSSELSLILGGHSDEPKSCAKIDEAAGLCSIARSPIVWWLCGQQIFRAAGATFYLNWLPTFLQVTRDESVESSGYKQGAILLAILPGSIFSGALADRVWRRTGNLRLSRSGVAAASLLICAASFFGAWFVEDRNVELALLAVGGFFGALAGPCAFAAAIDISGSRVPEVVAVMNMSGNFAAAGCPILVAELVQQTENWNLLLPMFAVIFFLSTTCWLFINPQTRLFQSLRSAEYQNPKATTIR